VCLGRWSPGQGRVSTDDKYLTDGGKNHSKSYPCHIVKSHSGTEIAEFLHREEDRCIVQKNYFFQSNPKKGN